ncbi:hypothetical protein V6N13_149490 [Hibiscus sabdariffa]
MLKRSILPSQMSEAEFFYIKDDVYDAKDLLDEIATKALQRKLEPQDQTVTSFRLQVTSFFSKFFQRWDGVKAGGYSWEIRASNGP